MAGKGINGMVPKVSKLYCSASEVTLVVRMRPHVVYGGGFVVSDFSQKVIFRVEGSGILGKRGKLILRDGDGEPLLVIRRKGGMVEALSMNRKWEGYVSGHKGSKKLVFKLKEPNSCFTKNNPITMSTEPRSCGTRWDFEIKGYFQDKSCSILDSLGNIIAQVGVKQELEELMSGSKDLYHVVVKPGIDQAFVFGVITVLDYIYRGSTKC